MTMMAASWFPTLTYQDFFLERPGVDQIGYYWRVPLNLSPRVLRTPSVSATASQGSGPATKIKKIKTKKKFKKFLNYGLRLQLKAMEKGWLAWVEKKERSLGLNGYSCWTASAEGTMKCEDYGGGNRRAELRPEGGAFGYCLWLEPFLRFGVLMCI